MLTLKILYELWPYLQHFERISEDTEYRTQIWLKEHETARHIISADPNMSMVASSFLFVSILCAVLPFCKQALENYNVSSLTERVWVFIIGALLNKAWIFVIVGMADIILFMSYLMMPDPRMLELLKELNSR